MAKDRLLCWSAADQRHPKVFRAAVKHYSCDASQEPEVTDFCPHALLSCWLILRCWRRGRLPSASCNEKISRATSHQASAGKISTSRDIMIQPWPVCLDLELHLDFWPVSSLKTGYALRATARCVFASVSALRSNNCEYAYLIRSHWRIQEILTQKSGGWS